MSPGRAARAEDAGVGEASPLADLRRASLAVWVSCALAAAGCARSAPVTLPPVVEAPPADTAPATPIERLREDLLAATRLPGVERGFWGVIVHSLDRNETIFELNSAALLVPASAAKLVSLASAAEAVGWDYRYETVARVTGPIVGGVLRGDLVVVGSGDPSIEGRGGTELAEWVRAVQAAGIHRIEGRIVGDDDGMLEPRPQLAWAWDDLGYTSGAIFGALNAYENRMTVTVAPGAAPGMPGAIEVEPHAAARPLINRTVTVAPGEMQLLWPEQRPGETALTIAGFIRAGAPPARLSVSVGNPTFWFASVLRYALVEGGIEVTGEAVDIDDAAPRPHTENSAVLFTLRSPTLAELARPMMKDSINLYAEAALRLNVLPGAFPTNDAALEGLRMRLAAWGVPPGAQQLIDGSGLSRRNVVSPHALLLVLKHMYDPAGASPFMTALPVAGVDGSLETRMRETPAQGNVRAKTGTMSNIRSLAGFVTTRDGEHLAFVILVNNFEGTGAEATRAIDEIAVRLASFTRGGAPAPPPASRPAAR